MERYDLSIETVMEVMERMLVDEFHCDEKDAVDITEQVSVCIIDFSNGDPCSDDDDNEHCLLVRVCVCVSIHTYTCAKLSIHS